MIKVINVQHFDTIIIGGGHNGLVCANYLGKAGQKVILLEASEKLGGLAATREFYPGFEVSVAHAINQFPEKIVSDLNLIKFQEEKLRQKRFQQETNRKN